MMRVFPASSIYRALCPKIINRSSSTILRHADLETALVRHYFIPIPAYIGALCIDHPHGCMQNLCPVCVIQWPTLPAACVRPHSYFSSIEFACSFNKDNFHFYSFEKCIFRNTRLFTDTHRVHTNHTSSGLFFQLNSPGKSHFLLKN